MVGKANIELIECRLEKLLKRNGYHDRTQYIERRINVLARIIFKKNRTLHENYQSWREKAEEAARGGDTSAIDKQLLLAKLVNKALAAAYDRQR